MHAICMPSSLYIIIHIPQIFEVAKPSRRAVSSKNATSRKVNSDYDDTPSSVPTRKVESVSNTPSNKASTPVNLTSDTSYLSSAQIQSEGLKTPDAEYKSMLEGFKTGDWMRQVSNFLLKIVCERTLFLLLKYF